MKLPIKSPIKPMITQRYGEMGNLQFYRDHGIKIPFHNGVDLVCGDNRQTYGTELVCPFPQGGYVFDVIFDSPMSTKGNGIYLMSSDKAFKIILWHVGSVNVKKGDKLKEGDVVGWIGNSGLCCPAPTPLVPYAGSHLHFGCYKYDETGGYVYQPPTVLGETDPLLYFNKDEWYYGVDSGAIHDIEPLKWRWSMLGIKDWFMKLIDSYKFWK
jgi:hypothetical protein